MAKGAFISYCSQDREFVSRLAQDLTRRGISIWFDETELEPGDSIIGAIEAGIDRMEYLIVVLSPSSVASGWVTEEVRMALHKGIAGKKFGVIPVLRTDCEIPGFLQDKKYVDLRPDADYRVGIEKIVRKISRGLEFKDGLQKLQHDLSLVKESEAGLVRESEPEKVYDVERLISLVGRAIRGDLSGSEWQNIAVPQIRSLGKVDVTFDQQNQRVKQQINIANLNLTLPIPPTQADPDTLSDHEAVFRRRVKRRFEEDAPYYIELSGETTEADETADEGRAPRSARRRRRRMNAEYRELIQKGRELIRVKLDTLSEAVDQYSCVILLGDPGCGKTTALQHLAYELAEVSGRLPLPLRLSEFEPGMSVEDFIVNGWAGPQGSGHWDASELADNLAGYLDTGKLFCLFDALNEMPSKEYAERAKALRTFINKWSQKGNRFLVSCRVLDYGEELSGLQRVEIQPLGDGQIEKFLQRELPSDWEALWQELAKDGASRRSLLNLARNPYMLTVIIDVYLEDGRLGRNRSELMSRFSEILMKWAKNKCPPEKWLDADIQRHALAAMAFEIQERAGFGTMVKTAQAKAVMPDQVQPDPKWPPVPAPPNQVLKLAASAHIIEMTGDRTSLRFYHQLLQEYFAGYEMLKRDPGTLKDLWRWPWLETEMPPWKRPDGSWDPLPPPPPTNWEETTILAAGLIPENDNQIVRALIQINPVLAGRCLYEGQAEVAPDVRQAVKDRLVAAISDPKVALRVRIAAGNVLGFLGDPRLGELVTIAVDNFLMGDDRDEYAKPQHNVYLPEYQIGKYPVTISEFAAFIESGDYHDKQWWTEAGWAAKENGNWTAPRYWDDIMFNKPNQPVVGVSWYECQAYCRWQSAETGQTYRLPSEAQWERAARGTDGRHYPWGKHFDELRLNCIEGHQALWATTPVGIYPNGASPYGCFDMAGNAWEWTSSLWGKEFQKPTYRYRYQPDDGRENLEAEADVLRVLRGGSWNDNQNNAQCANRNRSYPINWLNNIGFRVLVSPISAP